MCFGIICLENLISVTQKNVFGMNFAIIFDWGVYLGYSIIICENYCTSKCHSLEYHRGQSYYKKLFIAKVFGHKKRTTLQSKFLGLFSCKKGHASGSNIAKKIFWCNYFCNNYKMITKEDVERNYFVMISARMVFLPNCFWLLSCSFHKSSWVPCFY